MVKLDVLRPLGDPPVRLFLSAVLPSELECACEENLEYGGLYFWCGDGAS